MLKVLMVALLSLPMMAAVDAKHECSFAPQNDLSIPVGTFTGNGMTQEVFNSVLARIEKHYKPIVEAKGARFDLQKDWNDSTVNAYAQQNGNVWLIKMFGGLARHQHVTPDGFAMVACHEMGHHLAGAPKVQAWASNEGQSDYFATAKCARRIWAEDNNVALMDGKPVSEQAKAECEQLKSNQEERALCLRSAMAGLSLGTTLASLGGTGTPKIETPDQSKVTRTKNQHPAGQCRTDTYYQGALCEVAYTEDFDNSNEETGACTVAKNHTKGLRSGCWYKAAGGGTDPTDPTDPQGECPFGDQAICDQLCQINPNFPFCKKATPLIVW